jgi:hypothetical protein
MKLLSKKEYNRLKDIESKYNHFTGQEFTIYVGGRTLKARLMQLSKEELIHIILDFKSNYGTLLRAYREKVFKYNSPNAIRLAMGLKPINHDEGLYDTEL